jgi:hypothetical protein
VGEHRLAATIFTDMVGYTALSQKNEPQAMPLLDEPYDERSKCPKGISENSCSTEGQKDPHDRSTARKGWFLTEKIRSPSD